jgi:hypothetical protein
MLNCGALTDFYDEVDTDNIDFNCSGYACDPVAKDPSKHDVYPTRIWCQNNAPNYEGSKLVAYPKGSNVPCGNFYEAWPSALEAGIKADCKTYKCELSPADGDAIVFPFHLPKCSRGKWAFGKVEIPKDTIFTSVSWSNYRHESNVVFKLIPIFREESNPYLNQGSKSANFFFGAERSGGAVLAKINSAGWSGSLEKNLERSGAAPPLHGF